MAPGTLWSWWAYWNDPILTIAGLLYFTFFVFLFAYFLWTPQERGVLVRFEHVLVPCRVVGERGGRLCVEPRDGVGRQWVEADQVSAKRTEEPC